MKARITYNHHGKERNNIIVEAEDLESIIHLFKKDFDKPIIKTERI